MEGGRGLNGGRREVSVWCRSRVQGVTLRAVAFKLHAMPCHQALLARCGPNLYVNIGAAAELHIDLDVPRVLRHPHAVVQPVVPAAHLVLERGRLDHNLVGAKSGELSTEEIDQS